MVVYNRRRLVLASVLAGVTICASAGTMVLATQARSGERVDRVMTTVKAGKQQQFEDGPSGISVGERVEMCHDRATASRASRAMRGACGAPGPRVALGA